MTTAYPSLRLDIISYNVVVVVESGLVMTVHKITLSLECKNIFECFSALFVNFIQFVDKMFDFSDGVENSEGFRCP